MKSLLKYVALPSAISEFERGYLTRTNRIGLGFFALHLPVFVLLAALNDTGPLLALGLTLAVLIGPVVAYRGLRNPRHVSMVHGVTAMLMGGLLVHFGQGPLQIEMHFYFFALLAMLVIYANPAVILAASATVAVHHLVVWLVAPRSVFNYEAPVWVVGVHAAFVLLEATAACFIARSFFESVIGLERKVAMRTGQLAHRNEDMHLILDNVGQGFVSLDRHGVMSSERSAIVDAWFGPPSADETLFDALERVAPDFAGRSRVAFEQVVDGFMPLELTLDQMPSELTIGDRTLAFHYRSIGVTDAPDRFLVVVSDITSERERVRAELHRRETLRLFQHLATDRAGFMSFFEEATALVEQIVGGVDQDKIAVKRAVHTLKGNAALFGLEGVAALCHELESQMIERDDLPSASEKERLNAYWRRLEDDLAQLPDRRTFALALDAEDHGSLLRAIASRESPEQLLARVRSLAFEPTRARLDRFGEQAARIAHRCQKPPPVVTIEHHDQRLDPQLWGPLWSAFVHVVRNAVDHGLESPEERRAAGKSEVGHIRLATRADADRFVIEIEDDGRGIDWDKVREHAAERGLPHDSEEALEQALFADGLSTAEQVTELSGRGVGLGAVLLAVSTLGGVMKVSSQRGKGTRLELVFALATVTRSLEDGTQLRAA